MSIHRITCPAVDGGLCECGGVEAMLKGAPPEQIERRIVFMEGQRGALTKEINQEYARWRKAIVAEQVAALTPTEGSGSQ